MPKFEKFYLEELQKAASNMKKALKGNHIGKIIKMIRKELGMSQAILSKRAQVPQSTISRIEQGLRDANISTLQKILNAISCDLMLVPIFLEPMEKLLQKQARKVAINRIQYLKGTMNLENQEPDSAFLKELLKEEEQQLLKERKHLWDAEDEKTF